jgi:hypothetical protein
MLSNRYKFIFVHVSRTGGSSLERLAGRPITTDPRTAPGGNTDFADKHATLADYYSDYPNQYQSYFKFTVVRNPFDRLVSSWNWRCNIVQDYNCSLHDFTQLLPNSWSYLHSMKLEHMTFTDSVKQFNYIGRYENIDQDFPYLCKKLGLNYTDLPHTNKTNSGDYRQHFNQQTIDLVHDRFGTDLEMFGYKF